MRALPAILACACVPAGLDGFVVVVDGEMADPDGLPVEGGEVEVVGDTGEVLGTATTDAEGAWSFPVYGDSPLENVLTARASAADLAEGLATWEVNLLSATSAVLRAGPTQDWESVHRPLACLRLDSVGSSASVVGRIVDTSGNAVSGLSGVVQRGWDAPVGAEAYASFSTGGSGDFSVLVDDPGLYTVYVAPTGGWAGTRFPVVTTPFTDPVVATIAPLQSPGTLLATVMWGTDVDLDLHLTAPEREGASSVVGYRFHIWADEPVHPERPESGESYLAELIRSATSGPGPEVIQVNSPPGAGLLNLSVMDRTDAAESENPELAAANALVQWWNGEDIPRYAWVSPLARATTWLPVEIDTREGTVYAVEGYASGVDPADAGAF